MNYSLFEPIEYFFNQRFFLIYFVEKDDLHWAIHREDVPVFIPMAHSKDSFLHGTIFASLWAKLGTYLKTAESITLIGYGFPKTDLNNLNMFLEYRDKFKHIVVFDHKSYKRLTKIFGGIVVKSDAKAFIETEILSNKNHA